MISINFSPLAALAIIPSLGSINDSKNGYNSSLVLKCFLLSIDA